MSSINQDDRVAKFHDRAGASAGEYRKTLTALSTASLGVFFLGLTTKIDPGLSGTQRVALIIALSAMALSVLLGVTAWYADARWAYASGEAINPQSKDKRKLKAQKRMWHCTKSWCDTLIPFSFMFGMAAATLYIVLRVTS